MCRFRPNTSDFIRRELSHTMIDNANSLNDVQRWRITSVQNSWTRWSVVISKLLVGYQVLGTSVVICWGSFVKRCSALSVGQCHCSLVLSLSHYRHYQLCSVSQCHCCQVLSLSHYRHCQLCLVSQCHCCLVLSVSTRLDLSVLYVNMWVSKYIYTCN